MEYKVGQQLWFVPTDRRWGTSYFLTIEKVGKKWIHFPNNRKAEIENLLVMSGDHSLGRCYVSKDDYEASQKIIRYWTALRSSIHWNPTPGISVEDIEKACELLGLNKADVFADVLNYG